MHVLTGEQEKINSQQILSMTVTHFPMERLVLGPSRSLNTAVGRDR